MKKSILIIEILFMALLVGCQDDDSPNLIIEKESIQAEYNGGTINIPISCNIASKANIIYESAEENGWIFLLPTVLNGNGVYSLMIESYKNVLDDRHATLVITAGSETKKVTITQLAKPSLGIDPEAIIASAQAKEYTVTVTCRAEWQASVNKEAISWCTLSNETGTGIGSFTVHVSDLGNEKARTASISITSGELNYTLKVSQGEGTIINGLVWANSDVAEPNTFAASPDTRGLLYQYDSKIGYPNSSPNEDRNCPKGFETGYYDTGYNTWRDENNPCPPGWRVPTIEEIKNLVGTSSEPKFTWKEPQDSHFAIPGAIVGIARSEGVLATKEDMKGGIFLPQSGYRHNETGYQETWWPANITSISRPNSPQNWDRQTIWIDANGNMGIDEYTSNRKAYPVRCVTNIK